MRVVRRLFLLVYRSESGGAAGPRWRTATFWEAVLQNPDDVTGEVAGTVKFMVDAEVRELLRG